MSAPDRIWAVGSDKGGDWGSINGLCHTFGGTEYIRADLVPQWQPIETAPKDRHILVVQTQNNIIQVACGVDKYGAWKTGSGPMDYISAVTHWQPLTSPPPAT